MSLLSLHIQELDAMRKYPEKLYHEGSLQLLSRPKIAIVGTRHPNPYTRAFTHELSKRLAYHGVVIVSGAAGGVDTLAHTGAGWNNTIAVLPSGIDISYPVSNKKMIHSIKQEGLIITPFEKGFKPYPWSFVVRNEIIVALGDSLIVTEADIGSGSMRSVEYALEMGKPIYVLPHRLNESSATHQLLAEGKAEAIEDFDRFIEKITHQNERKEDSPFIAFCRTMPTYDEVMGKFPSEVFEAELSGIIEVRNGRIAVV